MHEVSKSSSFLKVVIHVSQKLLSIHTVEIRVLFLALVHTSLASRVNVRITAMRTCDCVSCGAVDCTVEGGFDDI